MVAVVLLGRISGLPGAVIMIWNVSNNPNRKSTLQYIGSRCIRGFVIGHSTSVVDSQ